jgi:hypothetical protein
MKTLTPERVRELFDYRDGHLIWRESPNAKVEAGSIAGTARANGYRVITVGNKFQAHRLVWLWHGRELSEQIDHINGDPSDNRIENLRAADNTTNAYNAALRTDNKSGVKNVSWCNTYNKWIVQILHRGGKVTGRFRDLDEAKAFATLKRAELHGEFASDGVR